MFHTNHYCGGYDATEHAFCFNYYDISENEFWVQISLENAKEIAENKMKQL